MTEEVKMADMLLPDGFALADLAVSDYGAPLAEAAKEITEQNERLIARAARADFCPAAELEYAGNGAQDFIHELFETVVRYEEGRVPKRALGEMVATTEQLLDALEKRPGAPMLELDAARVAFRKANILWGRVLPHPRRPRKVYLKVVFEHEREIGSALEKLHQAYVKAQISHMTPIRKQQRHDRSVPGSRQRADDRARVFQAIGTLQRERGLSVIRAIRLLRQNATWRMRLNGITDESWRNYYTKRNKRH